jgi:hypothetical protein
MTNKAFLILIVFGFLVSGCAGLQPRTPFIESNVSVFHKITEQHKGKSVVVLPFNKELENSLEFENYKEIIENNLQQYGFNIVQENDASDFITFVSYGIGGGKEKIVSSPILGSTGGGYTTFRGSAYNSGGGGSTSYLGSSYKMPTYGIVGSRTDSITRYTRQLAMDMVESSTLENKKINKVYEGRVKSIGTCSNILSVLPDMLTSLFMNFPRRNGSSETIRLQKPGGC